MKKTINAIVKEDLDEIGPFCGLHVEIPVEGFKEGDLVTVTYNISKAKDVEETGKVDDSMYLHSSESQMTTEQFIDFCRRYRLDN